MKKIITYFLLLLFVLQSTGNFWIVSLFYINRDYIAKELCVNRFDRIPVCRGTCYLEKKIADNEKKEQKIPNAKEKEIQLYFSSEIASIDHLITAIEYSESIAVRKDDDIRPTFPYSIFHPPKPA